MKKYNERKIKAEFISNILKTKNLNEALEIIEGDRPDDIKTIRNWRKKDIKFDRNVLTAQSYKKKARDFIEEFEKPNYDIASIFQKHRLSDLELGRWLKLFPDFKELMNSVDEGLTTKANLLSKSIMVKFADGSKKKESLEIRELANGKKIKKAKKEGFEYQASKDLAYLNNRMNNDNESNEDSLNSNTITFKIETSGYPIEIDDIKYLMQPDGTLQRFIEDD